MTEAGTGARLEQAMARLSAAVERLEGAEGTTKNPPAISDSLRQEIAEIETMLGKAITLLNATPQKGTHGDEG